jgi:hypothetical protein
MIVRRWSWMLRLLTSSLLLGVGAIRAGGPRRIKVDQ